MQDAASLQCEANGHYAKVEVIEIEHIGEVNTGLASMLIFHEALPLQSHS